MRLPRGNELILQIRKLSWSLDRLSLWLGHCGSHLLSLPLRAQVSGIAVLGTVKRSPGTWGIESPNVGFESSSTFE